jgi:hypothetical protein
MDTLNVTININGTHDGVTFTESGSFSANVRAVSKLTADVTNSFQTISLGQHSFVFAIITNTGDDDALVFFGRLTVGVPIGKSIVISGSTAEDVSGTKAYAEALSITARSKTSAGTRLRALIGY